MSFNTFGKIFRFTTWGESHGPAIGCVVDGCPPNINLDVKDIQKNLNKRKPGQSKFTTQRKEADKVEILSGVFKGKTTGTPISMIIFNKDMRSRDYETIKDKFRPGHADYTYFKKYGIRDYRGGGRQSARETASRVAAGAIAKIVLEKKLGKKFKVTGAVTQLGILGCDTKKWNDKEILRNPFFCPDKSVIKLWEKYLLSIRKSGSSCGAVIEIRASGIPIGLGAPIYSKLDADIASALMSINAVKGVNIGSGMNSALLTGTENSDEIRMKGKKVLFKSNNAGGILGGISSGQDIIASFAVKPTSSILQTRKTINTKGRNSEISVKGRHDPCVGIRAVPIGEAMINCVLLDHYLMHKAQCGKN
jgi:chorismate synthase